MNLKKVIIIISILLANVAWMHAQSIKVVRSDVESARGGFITAGYVFGFDVYLDSVSRSNGVSFELQWDTPQFIQFSQWKIGDIGTRAQAYVMDKIDQFAGHIYAVIGTGLQLDSSIIQNPKVLRLEFVLLQNAPDGDKVTFKFIKPTATAIIDSIPQVVTLKSEDIVFKFHGMVDVYPGDSDNNGTVDQSDFTQTLFYLGMGPLTKSVRTFKRQYASAYWTAQKCLKWDVASATYADCDGNGEINMDDLLIISYNLNKTQKPIIYQNDDEDDGRSMISEEKSFTNQLPFSLSVDRELISTAISIKVNSEDLDKIVKIIPSDEFGNKSYLHYKVWNDRINIVIGSKDNKVILPRNNQLMDLFNFVLTQSTKPISYQIVEARAIDQFGNIFNLINPTSVNFVNLENQKLDKIVNISYQNHQLFVNLFGEYIRSLSIVDLNGNTIKAFNYDERTDNVNLDLLDIVPQIYFVTVKTLSGKYFAEPVVMIK